MAVPLAAELGARAAQAACRAPTASVRAAEEAVPHTWPLLLSMQSSSPVPRERFSTLAHPAALYLSRAFRRSQQSPRRSLVDGWQGVGAEPPSGCPTTHPGPDVPQGPLSLLFVLSISPYRRIEALSAAEKSPKRA